MKKKIKKLLGKKIVDYIHTFYPPTISKIYTISIKRKFKSFGKASTIIWPSRFEGIENIEIGNNTDIGAFVHIWGNGGVTIGNSVMIASHVAITSMTHDYLQKSMKFSPPISKAISIEDDVWIGSHAVILPGVKIGQGAVIGAGSVVAQDVKPFDIVVGIPAQVKKNRQTNE